MVARTPRECFGHYIGRAYAVASRELNFDAQARTCIGDEFPHYVDRFVWRILHGSRLNMQKHGISIGHSAEQANLALLREECEELFKDGQIMPSMSWLHDWMQALHVLQSVDILPMLTIVTASQVLHDAHWGALAEDEDFFVVALLIVGQEPLGLVEMAS